VVESTNEHIYYTEVATLSAANTGTIARWLMPLRYLQFQQFLMFGKVFDNELKTLFHTISAIILTRT